MRDVIYTKDMTYYLACGLETVVIGVFVDIKFSVLVECMSEAVAFQDFSCSVDRNQMGGTKNVVKGNDAGLWRVAFMDDP